jgi:hypothetical protein
MLQSRPECSDQILETPLERSVHYFCFATILYLKFCRSLGIDFHPHQVILPCVRPAVEDLLRRPRERLELVSERNHPQVLLLVTLPCGLNRIAAFPLIGGLPVRLKNLPQTDQSLLAEDAIA